MVGVEHPLVERNRSRFSNKQAGTGSTTDCAHCMFTDRLLLSCPTTCSTESRSLQREIESKTSSHVSPRFCLFFAGHLRQKIVQTPRNEISREIIPRILNVKDVCSTFFNKKGKRKRDSRTSKILFYEIQG